MGTYPESPEPPWERSGGRAAHGGALGEGAGAPYGSAPRPPWNKAAYGAPVPPPPGPWGPPARYPGSAAAYPPPGPYQYAYQVPSLWAPPYVSLKAPSANTALILGVVSVVGSLVTCLIGFVGIAAIIYGNKAREEIRRSGGMLQGSSEATTGIVCGWIGTILASLWVVFMIVLFGVIIATSPD